MGEKSSRKGRQDGQGRKEEQDILFFFAFFAPFASFA
jgi:hypothetical protein